VCLVGRPRALLRGPRKPDHAAIFLLIAGTYTPIGMLVMPADSGHTLLWAIWIGAALGIAVSMWWPQAPKWVSASIAVAVGWMLVPYIDEIAAVLSRAELWLIALGGIAYTAGAMTRRQFTGRVPGRFLRARPRHLEWIGGCLPAPLVQAADGSGPSPPVVLLWVEMPEGLIVGLQAARQEDASGALARLLTETMAEPAEGPPRRPDRIRVADVTLAAELRAVVAGAIPITVVPTPELDEALQAMLEALGTEEEERTYLQDGSLTQESVGELFAAAREFHRRAPWLLCDEDELVRVDAPALGIEAGCLSIVGAVGDCFGFMLFPSRASFERFEAALEEEPPADDPIDYGTTWHSLTFEDERGVAPAMRREAKEHGWALAEASAFPIAERCETDGEPQRLLPRDLEIITACAGALAAFFGESRREIRVHFGVVGEAGSSQSPVAWRSSSAFPTRVTSRTSVRGRAW
jgi:hypothetical protein